MLYSYMRTKNQKGLLTADTLKELYAIMLLILKKNKSSLITGGLAAYGIVQL